jgi:integrase
LELSSNPAAGIKNPAKVKPRDRILDRSEIRIVWEASQRAGYPYGHALRFQLCTGQRIGEVGGILRSDVEGDFWRLSRTKTGKRIDVFLAGHAREILDNCLDFGHKAPYFSASGGKAGLRADGFHNALNRHVRPLLDDVADELELPRIADHWTPHDLRRTVRSGLTGWCGVFPDIAERTINHAVGGIRAVYDHADYRPHIAEALQAWDQELGRILAGRDAEVVPMRRGTA